MFAKSEYSMEIEIRALFATNIAIYALQKKLILSSWLLLKLSKETRYILKISYPGSRTVATNFFFSISLTYLIVERVFSMV